MSKQLPLYWWLLNGNDIQQYTLLRSALITTDEKSKRNKKTATFVEAIEAVKKFAVRGDPMDKIRCLVCGIAWLPEGIAINTRQLRLIISRCKSSINGSLQKLGYTENLGRTASANALTAVYPSMKENMTELRKWSVRRKPVAPPMFTPQPDMGQNSVFNDAKQGVSSPIKSDESTSPLKDKKNDQIFPRNDETDKYDMMVGQDSSFWG